MRREVNNNTTYKGCCHLVFVCDGCGKEVEVKNVQIAGRRERELPNGWLSNNKYSYRWQELDDDHHYQPRPSTAVIENQPGHGICASEVIACSRNCAARALSKMMPYIMDDFKRANEAGHVVNYLLGLGWRKAGEVYSVDDHAMEVFEESLADAVPMPTPWQPSLSMDTTDDLFCK
jgi:hypothetical protein